MKTDQAPMHYYKFNEDGEPIRSDFHFSDKEDFRMTFEEFWVDAGWHIDFLDLKPVIQEVWEAAQKAERERIKGIVQEANTLVKHNVWTACADAILKRIDSER